MPPNQQLFEEWLEQQPTESHKFIRNIRETIIDAGHDYTEAIKWGSPSYWLPEVSRRNIVYIAPHNSYVRLGFFNGATMPDPKKILEGSGKKLRHIKIHNLNKPTDPKTLTTYIQLATQHAIQDPTTLAA